MAIGLASLAVELARRRCPPWAVTLVGSGCRTLAYRVWPARGKQRIPPPCTRRSVAAACNCRRPSPALTEDFYSRGPGCVQRRPSPGANLQLRGYYVNKIKIVVAEDVTHVCDDGGSWAQRQDKPIDRTIERHF